MSQDPVVVELVRRVTNLEDDLMRQTARISVPISSTFFSYYANATTTVGSASWTTVNLAGLNYTDGNFNTTTSTYTVPVAGHYLFCGAVYFSANGAGVVSASVFVTGVEAFASANITAAANFGGVIPVSGILALASGATVTLRAWAQTGATVGVSSASTFLMGQIQ